MSVNISKLNFSEKKYGISFEQLDLNKNGTIDADDLKKVKDDEAKSVLTKVLEEYSKDEDVSFFNNIKNTASVATADETEENNATTDETTGTDTTTKTNAQSMDSVVADLKAKYSYSGGKSSYTIDDPAVSALKQAVDDGVIAALGSMGFSQSEVATILSKVFPEAGISANNTGGYTIPNGHDSSAAALYNQISSQIGGLASDQMIALQQEIAQLNTEIANNNLRMNNLKGSIDSLAAEIEREVDEAIQESEEIAEEQKEQASSLVSKNLQKYKDANGEMSYDTFESNLSSDLDSLQSDGDSKISEVVLKLVRAEDKMGTLKEYIDEFGRLNEVNKDLKTQVEDKQDELEEVTQAATSGENESSCDPIGFTNDGVQYDFFVDRDGNGDLSNETEFLGAENGWQEMADLDADGDGKIVGAEMSGLKVVATEEDGTQTIKDASEIMGEGDFIDLTTYNAKNQTMDNGNTLLGTFGLYMNGQELDTGYNTLDKVAWLDSNYNFSDADQGINRFSQGNTQLYTQAIDYTSKYNEYLATYSNLEEKLEEAWNSVRINRDSIVDTGAETTEEASTEASTATAQIKAKKAEVASAQRVKQEVETKAKEKVDQEKVQEAAQKKVTESSKKVKAAETATKKQEQQNKVKTTAAETTKSTKAQDDEENIDEKIIKLEDELEELKEKRQETENKIQELEDKEDKTPSIQASLAQYQTLDSDYKDKIKKVQDELTQLETKKAALAAKNAK